MRKNRNLVAMLVAVALLAGASWAQDQPATQPTQGLRRGDLDPATRRRAGPRANSEGAMRRGPMTLPNPGRRPPPLTDDEQAQAKEWARENMPNLHKLLSESGRLRPQPYMRFALARRRMLEQAESQPLVRERVVRNLQLEDSVFEAVFELEKASADQMSAVQEKIRARVSDMVDALLEERAERIERLKSRLAEEEQQLAEDRDNKEQRVENMLRQFGVALDDPIDGNDVGAPVNATPAPTPQRDR